MLVKVTTLIPRKLLQNGVASAVLSLKQLFKAFDGEHTPATVEDKPRIVSPKTAMVQEDMALAIIAALWWYGAALKITECRASKESCEVLLEWKE